MKEVNDEPLYFYSSKIKNAFLIIMCVLFVVLGFTVSILGYQDRIYVLVPTGLFFIILFGMLIFYPIKRTFTSSPYIILTDKELIIDSFLIKDLPIKREDVGSYDVKHQNFHTSIELIVPDEKKYKAQLSEGKRILNTMITMGGAHNTFIIGMNQVKKKDRSTLYYVLDNMNKPGFQLKEHDQMEQSIQTKRTKDTFQLEGKITVKYFLKTYVISLLIGGFSWSILSIGDIPLIIGSFLLFPFAKVFYDAVIGFKIDEKIKKQDRMLPAFYGLIYTVYLLLFLFSFFVAPFGILFLIIRAMYRFFKKLKGY